MNHSFSSQLDEHIEVMKLVRDLGPRVEQVGQVFTQAL